MFHIFRLPGFIFDRRAPYLLHFSRGSYLYFLYQSEVKVHAEGGVRVMSVNDFKRLQKNDSVSNAEDLQAEYENSQSCTLSFRAEGVNYEVIMNYLSLSLSSHTSLIPLLQPSNIPLV